MSTPLQAQTQPHTPMQCSSTHNSSNLQILIPKERPHLEVRLNIALKLRVVSPRLDDILVQTKIHQAAGEAALERAQVGPGHLIVVEPAFGGEDAEAVAVLVRVFYVPVTRSVLHCLRRGKADGKVSGVIWGRKMIRDGALPVSIQTNREKRKKRSKVFEGTQSQRVRGKEGKWEW